MGTARYDIHGVGVEVACEHSDAAAALDARLERFRAAGGSADLAFDLRVVRSPAGHVPRPVGEMRVVYESAAVRVLYTEENDELWIDAGVAYARCAPEAGQTTATVLATTPRAGWLLSHPLFTVPLLECLKRRGMFSLHAAGASAGGVALLLSGASGAGKSTLALALARAGFAYLGDDLVFLRWNDPGLETLAFPEEVDVADGTVALLSLSDALAPARVGWPKRQISPLRLPGPGVEWRCRPAALVLPRVAGRLDSRLGSLDPLEALLALAPNVLLTDAVASQRHLDALASLANTCTCHRLETGLDPAATVTLLRRLMP